MINWRIDYDVIDMHTHMGIQNCLYYPNHDMDSMVQLMDEAGVEIIVSSPCEDLFNARSNRQQITQSMQKYPDRIKGYYGVTPASAQVSHKELDYIFKNNPGYVGFKLLPDYHRIEVTSEVYQPILKYADENGLLVLCHTWGVSMNGESCNSADKIIHILERYSNMILIMGHSIQGQVDLAIDIAVRYPNAYLDTCDTGRLNGVIEKMVRIAGADKILFGTDAPMQSFYYPLGAVLGARITPHERYMILRGNAEKLLKKIKKI